MGKLIILLSTFIFSFSLQARVDPKTGLDPDNDPNLRINSLARLHEMLPSQNVTSGVCTDPDGCEEERIVRASLQLETAFQKQDSSNRENDGQESSRPSTK